MGLNSIHVDLDVGRHSSVVKGSETVVLVTHYSDSVNVNQRTRYIRSRTKRPYFETVYFFVVLKSLLQEVVVQVTAHIHRNYLYNASGLPPSEQVGIMLVDGEETDWKLCIMHALLISLGCCQVFLGF